ncbi:MAG: phage protease [Acidobacteriota bacterium]
MPTRAAADPRDLDRLYVFRVADVLFGESGEPKPIQIFAWGVNAPVDGRPPVVIDDAWADQAEGAFSRRTIDLAIDYNHASLFGFQDAPAAGWITALRAVRPGQEADGLTPGVWLVPEWTPEGRRRIRDREYRYMSAVLRRDYESGAALPELLGAALTNTPAIHGLEAVAASQISAAPTTGTEDNESANNGAEREGVTMDVLKEVGYASVEELKSALSELPKLRETAGQVEALSTQLAEATKRAEAAETAVKAAKVDAALAEGRAAGRVTKDNEAFARKLAERDLDMFGEWVKAEPAKPAAPTAPEGRLALSLSPADGDDREALLKKAQAYAKEHKCSVGEAYEALAAQASN